jgi:hypothetical protein
MSVSSVSYPPPHPPPHPAPNPYLGLKHEQVLLVVLLQPPVASHVVVRFVVVRAPDLALRDAQVLAPPGAPLELLGLEGVDVVEPVDDVVPHVLLDGNRVLEIEPGRVRG